MLAAVLSASSSLSFGGDQYIDSSGIALGGHDPVAYWSQHW
ncbi:MAG: hypothetical protein AB8B63_21235 [Granulosicoccus sp.]